MSSPWQSTAHRTRAALFTALVVSCSHHTTVFAVRTTADVMNQMTVTLTNTSNALEVDATDAHGMDSHLHTLHVSAYARYRVAFHSDCYYS